jgi:hypothetical protein
MIGKMETARLDDVLFCADSPLLGRMAGLKIDIEGFEWLMLQVSPVCSGALQL